MLETKIILYNYEGGSFKRVVGDADFRRMTGEVAELWRKSAPPSLAPYNYHHIIPKLVITVCGSSSPTQKDFSLCGIYWIQVQYVTLTQDIVKYDYSLCYFEGILVRSRTITIMMLEG